MVIMVSFCCSLVNEFNACNLQLTITPILKLIKLWCSWYEIWREFQEQINLNIPSCLNQCIRCLYFVYDISICNIHYYILFFMIWVSFSWIIIIYQVSDHIFSFIYNIMVIMVSFCCSLVNEFNACNLQLTITPILKLIKLWCSWYEIWREFQEQINLNIPSCLNQYIDISCHGKITFIYIIIYYLI